MMREESPDAVTDWQLERYRLGELPSTESERVRGALENDEGARARLATLEASDAELLARHTPRAMAGAIRARLAAAEDAETRARQGHAARPKRPSAWLARPALATVVGLALVAVVALTARPLFVTPTPVTDSGLGADPRRGSGENRVKGLRPHLVLFRQTTGEPEPLTSGSYARPGDVVQIVYQAGGRHYGVIVSADGRGVVTLHLPQRGMGAAALDSGGPIALDSAYALDDAPRWERFYFVTADAPFDTASVIAAARRTAAGTAQGAGAPHLELPPGLEQSLFVLKKETSS
jgi:hypothetical protein